MSDKPTWHQMFMDASAQLARAEAERDALRAKSNASRASVVATQGENERLRAERDALRADAERYRWLRNMDHWPACFDSYRAPEPVRGPELDAAIDAAKEAGK